MERKTSIIILSGLLLASFFAPFINWGGFTMSGFDMVLSDLTPQPKYILLAVPITALFLLVSALSFDSDIKYNRFFLLTPLLSLIALFLLLFSNAEYRAALGPDPFRIVSLGFWMIAGISLILAVSKKKRVVRLHKQYEKPEAGSNWMSKN
jgi:hypothetical protein